MSTKSPTHDLGKLRAAAALGNYAIFPNPARDAQSLRLDEQDILDCIDQITDADFYKTMESDKRPGLWQDVYKPTYLGIPIYTKLQLTDDGRALVISFKLDASA